MDEARAAFQAFVAENVRQLGCAAEGEAEALRDEIGQLSRRLVALERRQRTGSGRLAELRAMGDAEAFAGGQFEGMQALQGVRGIATEGSCLRIETEPVAIQWQGRRYSLGAFRLTLDLAGDVRVDSLEHLGPKSGWDHPHVQDGLPCLGNLRPGILKLIAEFELALAAQLLLDFLATYQPETAYTPIEGWPEA